MEETSKSDNSDFLSLYLEYSAGTECPTFFHRWAAITCLSAYLGRRIYFRQGHFKVHPNLYTMLVGDAGTKKSTSIKMAARLMTMAGYDTFAAKKTRQEKFLLDMAEEAMEGGESNILDQNIFGDIATDMLDAEVFITADEFNNFIGAGNTEFMSILGEFWDYEGVYDYKLKNSKSVHLNNPTVSILGGNTSTGMNTAFPPEMIGQGFFSRLLLIHAETTGVKRTWMPLPDTEVEDKLIKQLHKIKDIMIGEIILTAEGERLLDKIYKTWKPLKDIRFASYANRRFSHLLKLVLVVCANNMTHKIGVKEVVHANTLLTLAERTMPEALGEFGKGRNSDVAHKIMSYIESVSSPASIKDVWKHVYADLDRREQMFEILGNLTLADKVQVIEHGYLPKKDVRVEQETDTLDWSLVTKEELGGEVDE